VYSLASSQSCISHHLYRIAPFLPLPRTIGLILAFWSHLRTEDLCASSMSASVFRLTTNRSFSMLSVLPFFLEFMVAYDYPHFVNVQLSQTSHPASLLRGWLQSGHILTGEILADSQSSPRASSMARAMASGQESTSISLLSFRRAIVERQRIFFSCSTSTLGSTPHRSAAETTRHVASLCEGHPPAFPRLANTSQRPFSSLLTLMKSVPQPVLDFMVWPVVLWGLGRGESMPVLG